jgi:putative FmdB family regulatory protein
MQAIGCKTTLSGRGPEEVIAMPMYEYKCLDCGKEALLTLSVKDRDSGAVVCPSCKSKRMEQVFTSVMAKTSRKS